MFCFVSVCFFRANLSAANGGRLLHYLFLFLYYFFGCVCAIRGYWFYPRHLVVSFVGEDDPVLYVDCFLLGLLLGFVSITIYNEYMTFYVSFGLILFCYVSERF